MSEIKENQLIKLIFSTADGSEKELDCTIKKLYKDRIAIRFSEETIKYIDYLGEGEEINVKIFTPSGIKMFNAIILNSPLEAEFIIEFVEDYIEIQRRKYLRADLETKVIIQRPEKENIVTSTIDIGGGGIRFHFDGRFENKEKVTCLLYLPMAIRSIQATGVIISEEHLGKNQYVLIFTKIEERDRDQIIKKCIEIQAANELAS